MYKKVASVNNIIKLNDIRNELIDKYGKLTNSVKNLINIMKLKILAAHCNVNSIKYKGTELEFIFEKNANINLENLMKKYFSKIKFYPEEQNKFSIFTKEIKKNQLMNFTEEILSLI